MHVAIMLESNGWVTFEYVLLWNITVLCMWPYWLRGCGSFLKKHGRTKWWITLLWGSHLEIWKAETARSESLAGQSSSVHILSIPINFSTLTVYPCISCHEWQITVATEAVSFHVSHLELKYRIYSPKVVCHFFLVNSVRANVNIAG